MPRAGKWYKLPWDWACIVLGIDMHRGEQAAYMGLVMTCIMETISRHRLNKYHALSEDMTCIALENGIHADK